MRKSWSMRLVRAARVSFAVFAASNLVLQTTLVTYAQTLAVDPSGTGTQITTAPNGVPLINIAPANDAGLSHNKYTDFNVGGSGLILNNATTVGQSQLGGFVNPNPNLGSGAASLILNEVTSTNASSLAGVIEIHGVAADLVIANPNGIACNGCGFINTPRATLSTGTAVIGADGKLSELAVSGGVVEIGNSGLDASGVDYFDIVSRSAILNGALHGKDVGIFLGPNDFDYDARKIARTGTGNGSAPAFALDSSALGGMYAGRISLEGTEAGVGVRMPDNVVAGAGGMTLTSSGKLVMSSATSSGDVRASAVERLEIKGGVYSGGTLRLSSNQNLALDGGFLAAWNDVSLSGIGIELKGDLVAAGVNAAGALEAGRGTLSITALGDLDIGADTSVRGGAGVVAGIDGDSTILGQLTSDGNLSLRTANLALGNAALIGAGMDSTGQMTGSATLDITTQRIEATGAQLLSSGDSKITATGNLTLVGGDLRAGGQIVASGAGAISSSMRMQAAGDLSLNGASVSNSADLSASGGIALLASNGSVSNAADLKSGQFLRLSGLRIVQSGHLVALEEIRMTAGADGLIHSGSLKANGNITIASGGGVVLSGGVRSAEAISLDAAQTVSLVGGELIAGGDVTFKAGNLNSAGAIGAGRDLSLTVAGWVINTDLIAAKRHMDIRLDGTLSNSGTLFAAENLSIGGLTGTSALAVANSDGLIEANAGHLSIKADSIANTTTGISVGTTSTTTSSGDIPYITETTVVREYLIGTINRARMLAGAGLTLAGGSISNTYGLIAANGDVTLSGSSLSNTARDLIETTYVTTRQWWQETYCDSAQILGGCWSGWKYRWIESAPSYSTSTATINSVYSTIQATGTLSGDFDNRIDNIAIRQGAGQVGLSSGIGAPAPGLVSVNLVWNNNTGAPSIDLSGYLSGSSLHQIAPNPTSPYLIETRSEFVDITKFYNSDGFLNTLTGFDPELMQKRLGDAYIETRIIQDQISALTGRRYLDGQDNDYDQIKSLYDNALSAQATLNLSLGVALTPEQVAALTTDIVWYETAVINGVEVLVPRLYLAQTAQDGLAGGAQLLGSKIILASADLTNSGVISADDSLDIGVTGDLLNLGGAIYGDDIALDVDGTLLNLSGIISGGNVAIAAGDLVNQTALTRDTNATGFADRIDQTATIAADGNLAIETIGYFASIGGFISAGDNLSIDAGGNIDIAALEQEMSSSITFNEGFDSRYSLINELSTVAAGGNLNLNSQGDITLRGAEVSAGGNAALTADGDVTVAAVQNVDAHQYQFSTTNSGFLGLFGSQTNKSEQSLVQSNISSTIDAFGDLSISAGGNTTVTASTLAAGENLGIATGGDLTVEGQLATNQFSQSNNSSGFLFSNNANGNGVDQSYNGSFLIAGNNVALEATGDAAINGSNVVAGSDIDLDARNVTLGAAQTKDSQGASNSSSGLFLDVGNGGFGFGFRSTDDNGTQSATTSIASALSAGGDLTVNATQNIASQGAHLSSMGDLTLGAGEDIYLQAVADTYQSAQSHQETEFGIRIGVSENVSQNVTTLAQLPDSLNAGKGSGFNKAVTAASAALKAMDAFSALQNGNLASIEASIGLSHEKSSSSQSVTVANGGTLSAAGNITLDAGRDITAEGTQIISGEDVVISAGRDITLVAAQNTSASSNDSSSASIGLSASASIGLNGPSLNIGLNASGQTGNGSDQSLTYTNTEVLAAGDISITSGDDTTLSGARIEGDNVVAEIGGDLTIESLQDTSNSASSSAGGSVGLNFNPLNGGMGGSIAANGGVGQGSSSWVNEQSGVFAENGVDVSVGGNTDLVGGAIISDSGELTLDTATLTFSDLADQDKASSVQGGINLSAGLGQPGTPGWGIDGSASSRDKEQETLATVGPGTISIRDDDAQQALEDGGVTQDVANLNRDPDLAQQITRDEESYIGVYASDTSIATAIEAIDVVGKTLGTLFEEVGSELVTAGEFSPESLGKLEALGEGIENGSIDLNQLLNCTPGGQAFSLWHLIVTPAYAGGGCVILDGNGNKVMELSAEERAACVEVLAGLALQTMNLNAEAGGEPADLPDWVNSVAGQIRSIMTDEQAIKAAQGVGFLSGFGRELIVRSILGEEAYSKFQIEVLAPIATLGDIGEEALGRALDEALARKGITGQDARDIKLLASITIGGIAAFVKVAPAKRDNGDTVLGHYPEYVDLSNSMNARRFEIPETAWNNMTESQRWTANAKFLDRTISRGDSITLATGINDVRPGSYYEREINYMISKGYRVSADGFRLLPP